jgi:excisionase family DNA binding protein
VFEITRTTPIDHLPEFLSVAEAATWLGIGKTLCYELVQRGELPARKLGRLVRVQRHGLVALAKEGQR